MRHRLWSGCVLLGFVLAGCGGNSTPHACGSAADSHLRSFAAAVNVPPGGRLVHHSGPTCDHDNTPASLSLEYGYNVPASEDSHIFAADIGRDLASKGWAESPKPGGGFTVTYTRSVNGLRYDAVVMSGNTGALGDVLVIFSAGRT